MTRTPTKTHSLRNTESGYAEVWVGNLKHGTVYREKYGSTRTGTHWIAVDLRDKTVGSALTREEAIALSLAARRF